MAFEIAAKRGVRVFFGPRTALEGLSGDVKTEGMIKQLVVEITGQNILDNVIGLAELPKGSKVLRAIVDVEEVFVVAGTTPAINIGTSGSAGTNGFAISEAVAEAVGITEITSFNGDYAAELAAASLVGVNLSGAGAAVTAVGKMKVVIEYVQAK